MQGAAIGMQQAQNPCGELKQAPDRTVAELLLEQEASAHRQLAEIEHIRTTLPTAVLQMKQSEFRRLFRWL